MKKKNIFFIAAGVFTALLSTLLLFYYLFLYPNILVKQPSKQVHIKQGTSFSQLQDILEQGRYLSNTSSFRLLARLMHYDRKVIPGAYQLQSNMSNWQAIRLLRAGIQRPIKVVIHDVKNKADLAHQLTRNLEISANALEQLLYDPIFLDSYGFRLETVLAMFIPNTYEVYWNTSAKKLFARMHKEYQRFWNQARINQAKAMKLIPVEVATLASIVQKETSKVEEAPIIAGVYINRLKKKIALGSDPTLLYILNDPTARRVLYKHKTLESPYNTYKYRGLPPGPICSPSIEMIDAVLKYTAHDYLYFSAKEDFSGYHYFARSYEKHLRNARRYRRALNQARIYR